MKKLRKRTKKILAVIAVTAATFSVGVAAYAVFRQHDTDQATNKFVPADAEIAVQENNGDNTEETSTFTNELTWTPDGTTTYRADKQVRVKNPDNNENLADVFVRVALVPRWQVQVKTVGGEETADYSGYTLGTMPDSISGTSYSVGVDSSGSGDINRTVTFTLADDWVDNWIYKDGYFYCRTAIASGKETPILLQSVSVEKDFYEEFAGTNGCSFQVDVLADSIQADGGAADARWGSQGITAAKDAESGKDILQLKSGDSGTE